MTPRLAPVAVVLALALLAQRALAGEPPEDRSTLIAAARAFHAAVESGDLARIARFGCTIKGPFTEPEVKEAAKSVFGTLSKIRGRSWEFGEEVVVKDLPGGRRLAVKTSPTTALSLTAVAFDGRWCFLSVDDLDASAFAPRDPPVIDPAPGSPAPAVDPEVEKAVKEVVATMLRVPTAGDDAASWLLWRRFGIRELPSNLVGELSGMLQTLRAPDDGKALPAEVLAVGGKAPHRHARARLGYGVPKPYDMFSRAWIVLLVESEGWRVVRADLDLSPPPIVEVSPEFPVAMPEKVVAAAEAVLAAIDASDAKAFAARSAAIWSVERRHPTDADVKDQLEALHVKYGARPHKVGLPVADTVRGRDGISVPVLFGEAEDLLYLVFGDENAEWRLFAVSEGAPADFVDRAAPAPK